ncbi:MAG: HD domain-containing protein [Polyangiales bacterium]
MRDDLLDLLHALDGVPQDPRYHPEGDALYHSLQVFQLALVDTDDPALLAAALLHDVGKALRGGAHDAEGAELLDGLIAPRVVWLVAHHLDLLRAPAQTRRRFRGSPLLADLERLRRWDVAGRSPRASVCSPLDAVNRLLATAGAADALAPDAHDHALSDDDQEALAR